MVASGLTVRRDGQGRIQRAVVRPVFFNTRQMHVVFAGRKGQGNFDGLAWGWEIDETRGGWPRRSSGCEWFDADKVVAQVVLRHWRAGDAFQPAGMRGPVKLQDLFTNLRIPRADR